MIAFHIIASVVALAGLILDHTSTMAALAKGAKEKNPVARWILARGGQIGLLAYTIAVMGGFATLLCTISAPYMASGFLLAAGLVKLYFARKNFRLARSL